MTARPIGLCTAMLAVLAAPGCKPPPTDAAIARAAILPAASGPSLPLPSPDTAEAVWASAADPLRLVYGVPGQPVLVALECLDAASPEARLRITRHAPADGGAGALLALIGNRRAARIAVDARMIGGRLLWQGEAPAADSDWDTFGDLREATATIPGAGLVKLNPSPLPMQLVAACRAPALPADRA